MISTSLLIARVHGRQVVMRPVPRGRRMYIGPSSCLTLRLDRANQKNPATRILSFSDDHKSSCSDHSAGPPRAIVQCCYPMIVYVPRLAGDPAD